MATLPFTEEVTKVIEENTIWKSTKDATISLVKYFSKERYEVFTD